MVFIDILISLAMIVAAFGHPFFFAVKVRGFFLGLLLSIISACTLTIAYVWWQDISIELELWSMGVNFEALNTRDRMVNVAPDLRQYAEKLYFSPERLGIGWPLKAMFSMVLTIPYSGIVFVGTWVVKRTRA